MTNVLANSDKVKYIYNGSELSGDEIKVEAFTEENGYSKVTGSTGVVKNVVVSYKVGDGPAYLRATLPVNTTFTNVTDYEYARSKISRLCIADWRVDGRAYEKREIGISVYSVCRSFCQGKALFFIEEFCADLAIRDLFSHT